MNASAASTGRCRLRLVTGPDAAALVRAVPARCCSPCEPAIRHVPRRRSRAGTCSCSQRATPSAGDGVAVGPSVDRPRRRAVLDAARAPGKAVSVPRGRRRPAARGGAVGDRAWGRPGRPCTGGGWATVPAAGMAYGLDELDTTVGGPAGTGGRHVRHLRLPGAGQQAGRDLREVPSRPWRAARRERGAARLQRAARDRQGRAAGEVDRSGARCRADLPGLSIGGAGGVLDYPEDGSRQPRADVAVVQVRDGRLELVSGGRPERP